jgi:hypothetical protein
MSILKQDSYFIQLSDDDCRKVKVMRLKNRGSIGVRDNLYTTKKVSWVKPVTLRWYMGKWRVAEFATKLQKQRRANR